MRVVRPCCTWATFRLASACAMSDFAVAHEAARASAADCATSMAFAEMKPWRCSSFWRFTSRSALSASVQASTTRLREVSSAARASRSCALMSSCQICISNWPFFTRSPSLTARISMRPPMMVDILVRWQLSTVPARVLAIEASTMPRPTSVTTTGIGFGRLNHHTASRDGQHNGQRDGAAANQGRGFRSHCRGSEREGGIQRSPAPHPGAGARQGPAAPAARGCGRATPASAHAPKGPGPPAAQSCARSDRLGAGRCPGPMRGCDPAKRQSVVRVRTHPWRQA